MSKRRQFVLTLTDKAGKARKVHTLAYSANGARSEFRSAAEKYGMKITNVRAVGVVHGVRV